MQRDRRGARADRRRGDRRAAAAPATDGEDILWLAARRDRRGGRLAQRQAGPRPRPDAALRRPRHDDLDDHVPDLRARPQPRLGRTARRRARCGRGDRDAERRGAVRRVAAARHGRSTRRCASTRRPGSGRAARSVTSSSPASRRPGRASPATTSWVSHHLPDVFEDPRRVPTRPLRARGAREVAARRLRPLRDGPARLHRQALRLHRGARDRRGPAPPVRFELPTECELEIQQAPTLSPGGGLPVRLHARAERSPWRGAAGRLRRWPARSIC